MTRVLRSRPKADNKVENIDDKKNKSGSKKPSSTTTTTKKITRVRDTKVKNDNKGNNNLIKKNIITTKKSQVLRDRTNLIMDSSKNNNILKKGKPEELPNDDVKKPTRITRSNTDKKQSLKIKNNNNNNTNDDNDDNKKIINSTKKQSSTINDKIDDKKKSIQLRQSTLKESFSKAKKRSPTKPLKTSPTKKAKIQQPIYKKIKLTDDDKKNIDDESKLYDFEYYHNISDEKIIKKRKKKQITNVKIKKPKINFIDTKIPKIKINKNNDNDKLQNNNNNIINTINDFHRIPLAITGKNIEIHQNPIKINKQIINEQPKQLQQIQVVAQVHNIDENINDKSTTPIQAFRKTNVFQKKSSINKISDDVIEQIISQDDDDDDDDDYYDNTHDDINNDINQENISTPIQAFRKTNIFDKKSSIPVDNNIDSITSEIDNNENKIINHKELLNSSLTPVNAFRKTNVFNNDKKNLNNSLLSQQLSPIPKQILSNIDDSTPWRPCLISRKISSPLSTFSKVNNMVQSTPQNKKIPDLKNKLQKLNNGKKLIKNKIKSNENNENNENKNITIIHNVLQKKKLSNSSKSPRKFGTEISNLSGSISESSLSNGPSVIDTTINNIISDEIITNTSIPIVNENIENNKISDEIIKNTSIPIVNANIENDDDEFDENSENKENEITESPIKSPMKINQSIIDSPRRSFGKSLSKLSGSPIKLNFNDNESQPGPSGLSKRQPLTERRITKQSNLNLFLNLPEIPESTKITTKDGIFDDIDKSINSSNRNINKNKNIKDSKKNNTIDNNNYDLDGQENQLKDYHPMLDNKRPKKQTNHHLLLDDSDEDTQNDQNNIPTNKSDDNKFENNKKLLNDSDELNVNNLFGFCNDIDDDDSDIITNENNLLTSLKTMKKANKKANKKIDKPIIINNEPMTTRYSILKDKKALNNDNNEKPKMNKIDAIKAHFSNNKNAVNLAQDFSDTFDFGELEKQQQDDVSQVPLFVDLEPVHFKQPPRYSYNRKRHYNTSGETDDDDDDNDKNKFNDDKILNNKITKKKKKISKEEREQKKQLENWAKSLNQSFNEVDEFDLVVESVKD